MSTQLTSSDELLRIVTAHLPDLPEAQRRAALYLINHYARVPFLTATDFAIAAGTSQSSVTRLILSLGFANYAQFTDALSNLVLKGINETLPTERFARARQDGGLADLINAEVRHMEGLQQLLKSEVYRRCIDALSSSRRTVIVGLGAAASIAVHTSLYLARIRPDVSLLTELSASSVIALQHLQEKDCVLVFAVPRYIRHTQSMLTFLQHKEVPRLLVSDRTGTDLAPLATELLIVPITNGPTTAIPSAMFTLSSLMVEGIALQQPEQTMSVLADFEQAARRHDLFFKDQPRSSDAWQAQFDLFKTDSQL